MTSPDWTPGFIDPPMMSADIEFLMIYFLSYYLGPTPIGTRMPNPSNLADTINGFVRVEYGGGGKPNYLERDLTCLIHAYSPNEIQASDLCREALGYAESARGMQVAGHSITGVTNSSGPHRLDDPNVVGLTRYRATVTWRVPARLMSGVQGAGS